MTHQSINSEDKDKDAGNGVLGAQAELLQAVLATEAYPWLADETSGAYAEQAEKAGLALEISDDEATQGWQGLSAQLSQIWGDHAPSEQSLNEQLKLKFASRLPGELIARISENAQQVVSEAASSGQSMLDQMVACVQDVMTQMGDDDLRVMGRPMAMAMRGNSADEFVSATIQSVRVAEWAALSPIEQARLSLAAARYAISQVEG